MAVPRRSWKPTASLLVIVLSCLSVLATPWTAAAAPPKKVCAQLDAFDRLVCRQGALADQVEYTAGVVFAPETKLHAIAGEARLKQVSNGASALRQAERKNTKEDFRRQAKAELLRGKKGGHLVPLSDRDDQIPSGGDGICDYEQGDRNAECAAIDLGPSGGLQKCNPDKKNRGGGKDGLECDLVEATDDADEAEMQESAGQLDAIYDTAEDDLVLMNDTLDQVNDSDDEGGSERIARTMTTAPCTFPPSALEIQVLKVAVPVLRWIATGLTGKARLAAVPANQTAVVPPGVGGNASLARTPWEVASLIGNLAYVVADDLLKFLSVEQAQIKECLAQLALDSAASSRSLTDLQGEGGVLQQTLERIGALEDRITALQTAVQAQHQQIMARDDENRAKTIERVEEARWDIIQLLNTPQGQRPDFPVK